MEKPKQAPTKAVSFECHECIMYEGSGVETSQTPTLGEQTQTEVIILYIYSNIIYSWLQGKSVCREEYRHIFLISKDPLKAVFEAYKQDVV